MNPTDRMASYQIFFESELNERWLNRFEGLEIVQAENGITRISGVFDQAALHGILNRLRDLGVELISVERINPDIK